MSKYKNLVLEKIVKKLAKFRNIKFVDKNIKILKNFSFLISYARLDFT